MAAYGKKEELVYGTALELHGDGTRVIGGELFKFLGLSCASSEWTVTYADGKSALNYSRCAQPFFAGDELMNDAFFRMCEAFYAMKKRLDLLDASKRKSELANAMSPQFVPQCVPFSHTTSHKVFSVRNGAEEGASSSDSTQRRLTTTTVQPAAVWSLLFNPLRCLIELTCGMQTTLELNWEEEFDASSETWRFVCKPMNIPLVESIEGEFCLQTSPSARIKFDMAVSQLDSIEDGYLYKRSDFVLTVFNQCQTSVCAYFEAMFTQISANTSGIISSLLWGEQKDNKLD